MATSRDRGIIGIMRMIDTLRDNAPEKSKHHTDLGIIRGQLRIHLNIHGDGNGTTNV